MSLTREQVEKVSLLGRLQLTDEEVDKMATQLSQIIDYFELLNELDTEGVEPMAHAVELRNVFAADEPATSLPRDLALGNAPKRDDECYRVPAVLGD